MEGDQSEEAFAELAKLHSADSNAQQGGIYEDVEPGRMVSEFEDWALDPARKTGDTDIVQTTYGFHIMYFIGLSDEALWQKTVRDNQAQIDYSEWRTETFGEPTIEPNTFGERFVG